MVSDGKDWEGRMGRTDSWEVRDGHAHRLYLKCVTNKDLLRNTAEPCSVLCGGLDGRGGRGRMGVRIRMAEALNCLPETTTVLLISFVIQNYTFFKNDQRREGKGRGRIKVGI